MQEVASRLRTEPETDPLGQLIEGWADSVDKIVNSEPEINPAAERLDIIVKTLHNASRAATAYHPEGSMVLPLVNPNEENSDV
jgi:hypothetical protein